MTQRVNRFIEWLMRRETPTAARLTLSAMLLVCSYDALRMQQFPRGPRQHCLTFLCFLPEDILFNSSLFGWIKVVFIVAALFWYLHLLVPTSSWIAAVSFTVIASLSHETSYYTRHMYHFGNVFLIIYAVWYHLYRDEIRSALTEKRFFRTPLCPNWVGWLGLYYVSLVYTFSGFTKLIEHGFAWANGLSLQLWVWYYANWNLENPLVKLLLEHRELATVAQLTTLIGESFCFLSLTSRKLRILFGALLLSFHLASEVVFHYGFYGNIVALLSLFLLEPLAQLSRVSRKKSVPTLCETL